MLNKFLALILSLCLVIACGLFMASCGGGSDSDTDTAVSDTDSNTDTDSGTDSGSDNIEDLKAQTSKQLNENWNQLLLYFPDLCNSTEYGEEFTKLLMRVDNATTQKDLEKIMMSFNEMVEKIRDNFTFDFNAYKKDAITYANRYWNELLTRYPDVANNAEYTKRHNEAFEKINDAADEKELETAMNALLNLVTEISSYYENQGEVDKPDDLDRAKANVKSSLKIEWDDLCKLYPDLKSSTYAKTYADLLNTIEEATSVNELNEIMERFNDLMKEVQQNLTPDVGEYKKLAKASVENDWANLTNRFAALSADEALKSRYNEILNSFTNADTVEAVDEIMQSFGSLVSDIYKQYDGGQETPDITEEQKQDLINHLESEWKKLTSMSEEIAKKYSDKYNELLNRAQNVTTSAEINNIQSEFKNLLDIIDKELGGGQETTELTEEQKQHFIDSLNMQWNNIVSSFPEAKEQYSETFNGFIEMVSDAKTTADLDNIQAELDDLVETINKEFGDSGDISNYIEQIKSQIENRWQDLKNQYNFLEQNTVFTGRYDGILFDLEYASNKEAVDSALNLFNTLAQDVVDYYSQPTVEGTIQLFVSVLAERVSDFKNTYEDKITQEIEDEISRLYTNFYNSATVEDVYTNKDALLNYLSKKEKEFDAQEDQAELNSLKGQLQTALYEKVERVRQEYADFISGETFTEIANKQTEIVSLIESATTKAELEEIRSKINNEVLPYANEVYLNAAIRAFKQNILNNWELYSSTASGYEQLKNQLLDAVELCKDSEDINTFYNYCFEQFCAALQNPDDMLSWNASYCELTSFYISLFDYRLIDAACKNMEIESDLITYIKSSETIKQADERFAEFIAAFESVKDMVYAKKVELNTILGMEKKLGVTSDELIAEIISKVKVIGNYSDGSTKEFSLTSDMISTANVDFTQIGNYRIIITFKNEDFNTWFDVYVTIVPNMENATVVGTYNSTGYFLQDIDMGGSATMTLYNNGFLSFSDRYNGYFSYTDKGDYIEVEFGEYANCSVGLFALNKTENTFDYYYPAGDLIIAFNASFNQTEFIFSNIWVYGNYTTAGKYIAICNFGMTTSEDGRYIGWSTYCMLDMENKKFSSVWISNRKVDDERGTVFTWEENGSEFDLVEDLTDAKAEAKKQVKEIWDELVQKGYDVSYMENNGYSYDSVISGIDTALDRSVINDLLMNFRNYADMMKKNHFNSSYTFTEPTATLYVGDSIDTFIEKNLVGKTFEASLEYGTSVTITITKDMVTYNGDTSTSYSINFTISYEHELYGHIDFSFAVLVNPML